MSIETNQWTELVQPQSEFFKAHLNSLGHMGSTAVVHEAGILPLNATWYNMAAGQSSTPSSRAVAWPDPYQRSTVNVAVLSPHATTPSSFTRVTETPTSYEMEGVAVNLNVMGTGSNLYGNVVTLKHDMEGPIHPANLGAKFVNLAVEQSQKMSRQRPSPTLLPPGVTQPLQVAGIEGQATGRLFRSLSSYAANLTIAGAFAEQGETFSGETYDLAKALLRKTIRGIAEQASPNSSILLSDNNGKINGAAFESDHNGITVIQQPNIWPAAIIIASAQRPRLDEDIVFLEQHSVYAHGSHFDSMVLPGEAYTIPHIAAALGGINNVPKEKATSIAAVAVLGEQATQVLEDKIMGLMQERVRLSR